jgi:predicted dehydrogenase
MINLAQLGCGYWGPNLLRNFSANRDCRVSWVAEQSAARREYVEQQYPSIRTTASWEDVLADPEVDAVAIATPAASHYALTRAALLSGKAAFVEKPLAMSLAEARELTRLAADQQLPLMVGHTFLYNAAVRRMKHLLDSGDVGAVFYLYCSRLNLGKVRADVNAWWNLAPHDISILLYLLDGELPTTVTARGMDYIQPGVEDVVFATLTWENRITANVHVSWLDPGKVRRVTLVGSRRMIVYDDVSDDKLCVLDRGVDRVPRLGEGMEYDHIDQHQILHRSGDIWLPHLDFAEPLRAEAAHFLECVRTGRTPLTDGDHGCDVVAVLEAGQRSLQAGGQPQRVAGSGRDQRVSAAA